MSEEKCPECGGKGYVERENWHECELWTCPKCNLPHLPYDPYRSGTPRTPIEREETE